MIMSVPLKRAVQRAVDRATGGSEYTTRCYNHEVTVQTSLTKMSGWDVSIDGFFIGSYYEKELR
jgi:hypothetical protein